MLPRATDHSQRRGIDGFQIAREAHLTPFCQSAQSGSLTPYLAPCNIFIISAEVTLASLGQTWIRLLAHVLTKGTPMSDEGRECLGVEVSFGAKELKDPILERFGDPQMISNMEKVFFSDAPTALGHSYASLMRGPGGRNDLQDVISLLQIEPWSKRATLTLSGSANGKVPCINVVQFLVRDHALQTFYFARGQDIFRKFYADGFCIGSMARTVARGLGVAPGVIRGYIGSGHIYHADMTAIHQVLEGGAAYLGSEGLFGSCEPGEAANKESR